MDEDRHQQHDLILPRQEHPKYGNSILICGDGCMLGPHYYVFLPTLILLTALYIVLYINVKDSLITVWKVAIPLTVGLNVISYIAVGFSNPGIIVRDQSIPLSEYPCICTRCNVQKPSGARHCAECNSCIEEHDHHCPWIGKCVGGNNKVRFFTFLAFMFGSLIVFFIGTIHSQVNQQSDN